MKTKKGLILPATLAILLIISTLAIGFFTLVNSNASLVNSMLNSTSALYIAEAGVSHAIGYIMEKNENFSISKNFIDGEYKCEATLSKDESWSITSLGKIKNFHKTIKVKLTKKDNKINITSWQES